MVIAYSIKLFMVIVLYIHMWLFNRGRDRTQAAMPINKKEVIELGMHDATEFDNKGFRYTL